MSSYAHAAEGSEQGGWVLLLHQKEPYCYLGGNVGKLAQTMGRRGLGRVRLVGKNVRVKWCLTRGLLTVFLVFHSENEES